MQGLIDALTFSVLPSLIGWSLLPPEKVIAAGKATTIKVGAERPVPEVHAPPPWSTWVPSTPRVGAAHDPRELQWQRWRGLGEGWVRSLGSAVQTVGQRMDKQGATVQHRGLYSIFCDKP